MAHTVYVGLDVNELQTNIMLFVVAWVRTEKVPVPQQKIIAHMETQGIKDFTIVSALNSLVRKGYIKRAIIPTRMTSYIQVRSI